MGLREANGSLRKSKDHIIQRLDKVNLCLIHEWNIFYKSKEIKIKRDFTCSQCWITEMNPIIAHLLNQEVLMLAKKVTSNQMVALVWEAGGSLAESVD